MNRNRSTLVLCLVGLGAALAACNNPRARREPLGVDGAPLHLKVSGSYNLHLEDSVRFSREQPGSDAAHGRALFGLAADGETSDPSQALFEGPSFPYGGVVVGNGRTCFTCHRGIHTTNLGLPPPPLSDTIPLTDPLFTGLDADAQGDPDGMHNLDQLGLVKYRPNRFNLARPESDPYRQVFAWRKSIRLINVVLTHGFLNDGRGRVMREVDRGAVFSHTQASDDRFDDLFSLQAGFDLEAFQFTQFSDPVLAALKDPSDPMYQTLVDDPLYTVHATTHAQKQGQKVFQKACMDCHNTPNVFSNLSNVEPLGDGERAETDPPFAPAVARLFNVGVAERNKHNLRFTRDLGGGQFAPIVIPLAREDGTTQALTVTSDIGLAAATGRSADVGRFKVPQLRGVKDNAPYFHDNSAATLEEVVDFFNSDAYNQSKDGKDHPIHLNANERADLLEFLEIL